jgi:hypothetical protein
MTKNLVQITPFLHVPDLSSTLAFFCETLPFVVTFRLPNYAYIEFDGHGVRVMEERTRTLQADGKARVTVYIDVRDIDALHAKLTPLLAKLPADRVEPLMNKHYGQREFQVRMPDGDWITFGQSIA